MLHSCVFGAIGLGALGVVGAPAAFAESPADYSLTENAVKLESITATEPRIEYQLAQASTAPSQAVAAPSAPQPAPVESGKLDLVKLNEVSGWKGWNINFPTFSSTLVQDKGGVRSALAEHGLGLLIMFDNVFSTNLYNEPRQGPNYNPYFGTYQTYNGQKPTYSNSTQLFFTYDMSRLGIKGGQFQFQQSLACSSYTPFMACLGSVGALSYYQSMLNNKLELRMGTYGLQYEFIGAFVAGNLSNSLGPGAQPLSLVGVSAAQAATPVVRLKWNIDDKYYLQGAVARSMYVDGPSGNPYYDTIKNNWRDLGWSGQSDHTKEVYIGEGGYRQAARKDQYSTWLRAGAVYNNSEFKDFSRLTDPKAPRKSGNTAFYALFDRQITQIAPDGFAARGMYIGGAATWADPKMTAITQSYDAKLYWIGAFDSRPFDIISIVAGYQKNSSHLVDTVNASSRFTGNYGAKDGKSLMLAYMGRISQGIYGRVSVNYLSNPGVTYFGPSLANPNQRFMGRGLLFGASLSMHL